MKEIKVYKFWAPWCGPCKMLAPVFQRVKEENSANKGLEFIEVNADEDENEDLISKFGIRNIPTIIVYNKTNDKIMSFLTGLMNYDSLSKAIAGVISEEKDTSVSENESSRNKEKDNT